jgi:prepilin-type N-terminal cleavage/methylation domain-containing protein
VTSERRRDAGFTLPELLVSMAVMGVVIGVLGSAVFTIYRVTAASDGRMNNARSEQTLALWLPSDLASAESLDTRPGVEPCNGPCPVGSYPASTNIVSIGYPRLSMTESDSTSTWVNVAYRYTGSGSKYQVIRVVCRGVAEWSCTSKVVLADVSPPPLQGYVHGVVSPTWVVTVSEPFDPGEVDGEAPAPDDQLKSAKRVVVRVNGGGTGNSRGGGWKDIVLSMGSTDRGTLEPDELEGNPNFSETMSRCGGTFGLLVDKSYSLGDVGLAAVKDGVTRFIDAFAGTPVRLQIVSFNHLSTTFGGSWGRWFDMLDEAQVQQLRNEVAGLTMYYGTNWEDALFRMLKNPDGSSQATLPEKLIFFTDGVPTYDRLTINPHWGNVPANSGLSGTENTPAKNPSLPPADYRLGIPPARNWWIYVQEAFDRANYIASQYRGAAVNMIGVGVGPEFANSSVWLDVGQGGSITETPTANSVILARLVSGTDTGVPALMENGQFVNADVANMYTLPQWDQFAQAMEAVALAECGGTLTLRTLDGGTPSDRSITYQKTAILDPDGTSLPNDQSVITTSVQFPSGTFDFSIPGGDAVLVEIRPVLRSDLSDVTPLGWSCRSRGLERPFTTVPLEGGWTGIRVRVAANEAVSCRLEIDG